MYLHYLFLYSYNKSKRGEGEGGGRGVRERGEGEREGVHPQTYLFTGLISQISIIIIMSIREL